jgi:PhnB protein
MKKGELIEIIKNKTLFNDLSEGGKFEMPIADGPLGSYFGMFADKYGIQWMVNFDPKYNSK